MKTKSRAGKARTIKSPSKSVGTGEGSAIQRRFSHEQWDYLLTSEQEAHKQTMAERNRMLGAIKRCLDRLRRFGGDMVIEKHLRLSLPNNKMRNAPSNGA